MSESVLPMFFSRSLIVSGLLGDRLRGCMCVCDVC